MVTGTVISSTVFNAFSADIATGLSTVICKDGQTTATASIPFAQGITVGGVVTISAAGKLTGPATMMSPITNSLSGDVDLSNTANYFDGPSIAQGTSGTWYVSGTVTVLDTAGAASMIAKLWDGTTVIASTVMATAGASSSLIISLSGFITSPAANLRISVRDTSSTSGKIKFNVSGNSKDGTITAVRIA